VAQVFPPPFALAPVDVALPVKPSARGAHAESVAVVQVRPDAQFATGAQKLQPPGMANRPLGPSAPQPT
jgi:hypothetical protein